MYSIKSNPQTKKQEQTKSKTETNFFKQSPKIKQNQKRETPFSLIDLNEKHVNLKGIILPKTYEKDVLFSRFPEYSYRYNDESKKEYSSSISKVKKVEKIKKINRDYFKFYQSKYDSWLKDCHEESIKNKEMKGKIKESSVKTNFQQDHFMEYIPVQVKNTQQNKFLMSDILNLHDTTKYKSSESYLTNKPKTDYKKFNITSKSNSEWVAMTAQPSLLNHTSTCFHILNPSISNISKTKEEIVQSSEFNPIHRQKMLCEYLDITRVGCPNPLKDYRNQLSLNRFAFNRSKDLCSTVLDNYKGYSYLIDKPFHKS